MGELIYNSTSTDRFEFGNNWRGFLATVNEHRIAKAEESLRAMLGVENLKVKRFLDIGSGSGLFSLAARRLGAIVHSFDYDPQSVECTRQLKRRYLTNDPMWTIEAGDVLDRDYLKSLGTFDVVYAWGVLHHTGAMWQALANAQIPVAENGCIFVAIYNHQVYWTAFNVRLKHAYVHSPLIGKWLIGSAFIAIQVTKGLVKDLALLRNPAQRYRDKIKQRGMSTRHDWIDWVGGYPFETAKPEEIFGFYRKEGFVLEKLKTCGGGHGCNEYVFRKGSG